MGFDVVLCMGNSFPHLLDDHGDLRDHKTCFKNFASMLKPGGILIIDHRNYDYILKHGRAPKKNIYYNSKHIRDIRTQVIYENNAPKQITLNYTMDVEEDGDFILSYQPHTLKSFTGLLKDAFGSGAKHDIYADFKKLEDEPEPAFYIHVIEKPVNKFNFFFSLTFIFRKNQASLCVLSVNKSSLYHAVTGFVGSLLMDSSYFLHFV